MARHLVRPDFHRMVTNVSLQSVTRILFNLLPTGIQICVSLFRVAIFAWSVLQLDKLPQDRSILYFLGFLPFFGLLDVFLQSWSRTAQVQRVAWISTIGVWRIPFALLAFVGTASVWLLTDKMPLAEHGIVFISILSLLGSIALLWERWLAASARAMSAGLIEITVLSISVGLYLLFPSYPDVLLFCFVGYLIARLMALLIPGRAASLGNLPQIGLQTHHYLGFAVGQQVLGSVSASLPSIFATVTGSAAGLGHSLAAFRIMHSLAAIAALIINSIGARLFFGEATKEQNALQKAMNLVRRHHLRVDIVCLISLIIFIFLQNFSPWFILVPAIIMISMLNFRSSFEISHGRPDRSFFMQFGVLLISILVCSLIYEYYITFMIIFTLVLFFSFLNKKMSH